MRFMLLIYGAEGVLSEAEMQSCYADSANYAQELHAQGKFVSASPLMGTVTARSVRASGSKRNVTDGPFAETREQLGGYFMVDADDMDDAIAIASRIPAGQWGTVEVRPVVAIDGVPET